MIVLHLGGCSHSGTAGHATTASTATTTTTTTSDGVTTTVVELQGADVSTTSAGHALELRNGRLRLNGREIAAVEPSDKVRYEVREGVRKLTINGVEQPLGQ